MKIIISPAKKMTVNTEILEYHNLPFFIEEADKIKSDICELTMEEVKELWKCNDKLTKQNYDRFQKMQTRETLTPAILSYEGIQYKYMAPAVFDEQMLAYIQQHLRILSGFYGVLRPMDGVTPYRLEMQAKISVDGAKNLYEYWGSRLYEKLGSDIIINLASKEYSQCIERNLKPGDTYITCIFGEEVNGKIVQKGTYAKMARGEMVRFMAENNIKDTEEIKAFNRLGYRFEKKYSTDNSYVYIKN